MPFSVTNAAAEIRRVVLKFFKEKLELKYNAGEKYREYQVKQQKLDQEYNDLNRRLNTEDTSEEAYQELINAIATARRRLADNICTVIEWWDLEDDLDLRLDKILRPNEDEEDEEDVEKFDEALEILKAEYPDARETRTIEVAGEEKKIFTFGVGVVPISGFWLDALPLPDEFIIGIRDKIGADFESGGAGGKAR